MPLPKLNTPTYELTLPSSNRKVKYRPFLVKEEKILLIAMESEDEKEMQNAVKQILKNCILTRGISVDKLAVFDIEYLFLNIRGKSVGEEITLNIVCPDDEKTEVEVAVNVEDVKIQKSDKHDPVIQLTDQVGIVMKYPSMEMFVKNNITGENQQKVDTIFDMTIDCISQVVEGEDVLEAKSFSKKEMLEFVETFDTQQFQKIQDFFETMPKLSHNIKVLNPNTNIESEVTIEGLSSFFD